MRDRFYWLLFGLLVCNRGVAAADLSEVEPWAGKPNFIIIFTDDQGYNDLGCFGSPQIRTPNIDGMAAEGMRFTSFYSGASVCTPSRAALLTGCYPERVGNLGVLFPHSDRGLNPEETTTADMLHQHGYATACFGKWHLGHHQEFLPTEHGFDQYLGIPYSNDMGVDATMPLSDGVLIREGKTKAEFLTSKDRLPPLIRGKQVVEWPADQTQLTKRYTAEAVRFMTEHADEPFFLYLPHTMPHIPLYASDEFRGRSEPGLYGDTLEEIDWSVGQVLKTLKDLEIDERTMVVYTSDNGPWNLKGNDTDKVKGNMNRRIGGSADPLRGHKFSKWEGGMRVPCVMRWPGRIAAGKTCNEIAASIDLLPTIAEFAGAVVATDRPIDGKSIVPLLEARPGAKTPHQTYFYRTTAVRSGKWKFFGPKSQLFDLEADIAESHNVADQHPDVVARLKQLLEGHRADMKTHGRPPAYYQRPAHALNGLEGWIVQSGRWNIHRGKTLRQNSDWTDAVALSPKFDSAATVVEFEAQLLGGNGGLGIDLLGDRGPSQLQFSLRTQESHRHGATEKTLKHQSKSQVDQRIDGKTWYRVKLVIHDGSVEVTVNGQPLAEHGKAADVRQIALSVFKSKAEFRGLKVTGESGAVLLDSLAK